MYSVDRNSVVEVLFTGSMCAQYFLAINDGDVVQLSNYSVEKRPDGIVEFFFEHLSQGYVRHVPGMKSTVTHSIYASC